MQFDHFWRKNILNFRNFAKSREKNVSETLSKFSKNCFSPCLKLFRQTRKVVKSGKRGKKWPKWDLKTSKVLTKLLVSVDRFFQTDLSVLLMFSKKSAKKTFKMTEISALR